MFKSNATCFGSQRIHHQGALYSAWIKITRMILYYPLTWTVVGVMSAYSDPFSIFDYYNSSIIRKFNAA
jgi:hypothetical protein